MNPFKVIIIGGGITGLSAAYRLLESRESYPQLDIKLFEAQDRLGGTIQTISRDGFTVELGPDSFLSTKPWLVNLCERLGCKDRIIQTNNTFRRSSVVYQGNLHPLPEGFLMMAPVKFWPFITSPLFSWSGKLRMGMELFLPRGEKKDDESLGSFVTRRLGREALDRVAQPLIGGIYTGDPDNLSLRATMPRFLEMEEKYGSIIKAMWKQQRVVQEKNKNASSADSGARYSMLVSFDQGIQTVVDELEKQLPTDCIHTNQKVNSIQLDGGQWSLTLPDGSTQSADAVILALSAHKAAKFLKNIDSELSEDLAAIPYASSAIVNLAYKRSDIPAPMEGFGFVVPAIEDRKIIAATFCSVKFPGRAPEGHELIRVFVGGAMQSYLYEMDENQILNIALEELRELMGIQVQPLWSMVTRWPTSMPQYRVGHLQHVAKIQERVNKLTGLSVVGNAYNGVGLPDCVHAGETAAEQILELLNQHRSAESA